MLERHSEFCILDKCTVKCVLHYYLCISRSICYISVNLGVVKVVEFSCKLVHTEARRKKTLECEAPFGARRCGEPLRAFDTGRMNPDSWWCGPGGGEELEGGREGGTLPL